MIEHSPCIVALQMCSGLNADDDAFADIDEDEDLSLQVCASIPDNVIDLFLLYNGDDN